MSMRPWLEPLTGKLLMLPGVDMATSLVNSAYADSDIAAYTLVRPVGDGTVTIASLDDEASLDNPIWLTLHDAAGGEVVAVLTVGDVSYVGWSWTPLVNLYLGLDGAITEVPSSTPVKIGRSTSATTIAFDPTAFEEPAPVFEYVHDQPVASTVWTVIHNLNGQPNVTTVDTSGQEIEGTVTWPDANTVVITFSAATGGKAYLS